MHTGTPLPATSDSKHWIYLCVPRPSSWPGVHWICEDCLEKAQTEREKWPVSSRWNSRFPPQTFFNGVQLPFGKKKKEPTAHPGASAMLLMRLFTKFFIKGGGTSMLTCHDVCLLGSVFIVGLFFFLLSVVWFL